MTLENIRDSLPDYARDLKLNLGTVLTPAGAPGLSERQIWAAVSYTHLHDRCHRFLIHARYDDEALVGSGKLARETARRSQEPGARPRPALRPLLGVEQIKFTAVTWGGQEVVEAGEGIEYLLGQPLGGLVLIQTGDLAHDRISAAQRLHRRE